MSRSIRHLVVALAATVVSACAGGDRELPLAPRGDDARAPIAIPQSVAGPAPSFALADTVIRFTVGREGGVFEVGAHALVFPADVICDPATSGYGPAYWSAPCTTLATPIEITAKLAEVNGRAQVTFSPDLRFAPSSDPERGVWLFLRGSTLPSSNARIVWQPTGSSSTVDEGAVDSSLRTYLVADWALAYRRVGHFSGYVVTGD